MRSDFEFDAFRARGSRFVEKREGNRKAAARHRQLLHRGAHCLGKRLRSIAPFRRQFFRRRLVALARERHFALERLRIDRKLELGEALLERGEPLGKRLGTDAVPARGGVQGLDARLDFVQRGRVELDARGVLAQLAGRLAGLRRGGLEQLHDRAEARVVRRQRAQPARHRAELREAGALRLGKGFERGLRPGEQARAVLQPRVLGCDLIPFTLTRVEFFQFVAFFFDVGTLNLPGRVVLLRFFGHRLEPLPGAVGIGGRCREFLRTGMRIEQLALRRGAQQRLVLVLAVDIDQVLSGFPRLCQGGGVAVDEAARASRAIDGPSQDDLARISGQITLAEPLRQVFIDIESRRQLGALRARAHAVALGAAAHQQLDRIDQDRLAGAGLSREHAESRVELERRVLDDDEVADV